MGRYRVPILFIAFLLLFSLSAVAQWQGVNSGPATANGTTNYVPQDNVLNNTTPNYDPNTFLPSTIYLGDGMISNGSGGWTWNPTNTTTCVRCHPGASETQPSAQVSSSNADYCASIAPQYAVEGNPVNPLAYCGTEDTNGYMLTSHKNVFRKVIPGGMAGPDGALYAASDPYGDTYNWTNGTVTNNSGTYDLTYVDGDWMLYPNAFGDFSGVYNGGFTGLLSKLGSFGDCARCHTTGYRPDNQDRSQPLTTRLLAFSLLLLMRNCPARHRMDISRQVQPEPLRGT